MASGTVHKGDSTILMVLTSLASAGLLVMGETYYEGFAFALGCGLGAYLTPDLDVNGSTIVDSLPLGGLVRFVFAPYSWLVPHRSFISHMPIVGTLGRQAYLALVAYVILMWWFPFGEIIRGLGIVISNPLYQVLLLGLILSDFLHWIRDL